MTDKTKWKSVICYPSTQEKVQDLSNLYNIPMCHVLRNIVEKTWNEEFGVGAKNPFLDRSKKYRNIV